MDDEKLLTEALQYLADYNERMEHTIYPTNLLRENNTLSDSDRYLILQKFVIDGYATIDDTSIRYNITFLGKMFLRNGGYVTESKRNNRINLRTKYVDYALIFGGVGAVLSALYLLGSALLKWAFFFW